MILNKNTKSGLKWRRNYGTVFAHSLLDLGTRELITAPEVFSENNSNVAAIIDRTLLVQWAVKKACKV